MATHSSKEPKGSSLWKESPRGSSWSSQFWNSLLRSSVLLRSFPILVLSSRRLHDKDRAALALLTWLTYLRRGAGLQSLTSRRAIPTQDFKVSFWNCFLDFNSTGIFQWRWWSTEVHPPPTQRCTTSGDNIPGLCKGSVFSRLRFRLHGTQHCSDLFPSGNAGLNQHGVHMETPCLQHARVTCTCVKHWKKCRHWKKIQGYRKKNLHVSCFSLPH